MQHTSHPLSRWLLHRRPARVEKREEGRRKKKEGSGRRRKKEELIFNRRSLTSASFPFEGACPVLDTGKRGRAGRVQRQQAQRAGGKQGQQIGVCGQHTIEDWACGLISLGRKWGQRERMFLRTSGAADR